MAHLQNAQERDTSWGSFISKNRFLHQEIESFAFKEEET